MVKAISPHQMTMWFLEFHFDVLTAAQIPIIITHSSFFHVYTKISANKLAIDLIQRTKKETSYIFDE